VVNSLNEMEFKCLYCEDKFKYSGYTSHQEACKNKTYDCPIPLCGKTNIKLADFEAHWNNECLKVNLTCSSCHIVSQRDGIIDHNCVERLLKERALEQEIIAKQKAEIDMLKAQNNELKLQILQSM
jgi:hypothetical protein